MLRISTLWPWTASDDKKKRAAEETYSIVSRDADQRLAVEYAPAPS